MNKEEREDLPSYGDLLAENFRLKHNEKVLQKRIDKAISFLEKEIDKCNSALTNPEYTICGKHELLKQEKQELIKSLEILKGEDNNE